jgi:hypothetical protein
LAVRKKIEDEMKKQVENERAKVCLADEQKRRAEEAASLQAAFEQEQLRLQKLAAEAAEAEDRASKIHQDQTAFGHEQLRLQKLAAEAEDRASKRRQEQAAFEQEQLRLQKLAAEAAREEDRASKRRQEEVWLSCVCARAPCRLFNRANPRVVGAGGFRSRCGSECEERRGRCRCERRRQSKAGSGIGGQGAQKRRTTGIDWLKCKRGSGARST